MKKEHHAGKVQKHLCWKDREGLQRWSVQQVIDRGGDLCGREMSDCTLDQGRI